MIVVVSTCILAVVLTYLSKYKNFHWGFEVGFIIVTIVACLHYNYGNDYMRYYFHWQDYAQYSFSEIFNSEDRQEPGWILLNWLFGFKYGFFVLVIVLSIFQNFVFYKLIKDFSPLNWRWLGFFIYLFSNTFYILNFSMLRQALSISIIVLSFSYIYKNKLLPSICLIIAASFIHTSALVFLPAVFIGKIKKNYISFFALIFLLLTAIFYLVDTTSLSLINSVLSMDSFESYDRYTGYSGNRLGMGVILMIVPYLIIIYFLISRKKELDSNGTKLAIVCSTAILFIPFTVYVSLIARAGWYYSIFQIATVPLIYSKIKMKLFQVAIIFILLFINLYNYFNMLNDPVWFESYHEFHTIFEAI